MRRGGKPAKPKVEAKPPVVRPLRKDESSRVRDLEKRLAEALEQLQTRDRDLTEALEQQTATAELLQTRNRELAAAQEQQTATADILQVISQSQTDVQPVFDTVVERAVRLCGALYGAVFRFDGELVHLVAHHNFTAETLEMVQRVHPRPPSRAAVSGRAILSRGVAQIPDVLADPEY